MVVRVVLSSCLPFWCPLDAHPTPFLHPAPPPTEAVVSAILPLCRFLAGLASAADAPPGASKTVASHIATSLALLRTLAARPGSRASAGRWQAVFAQLNADLAGLLDVGVTPALDTADRAAISAAYADLVRAWLPRFGGTAGAVGSSETRDGGAASGGGAAAEAATARMLTGFKRALRDPARPLPVLPGDAGALLATVAAALGVDGGGGSEATTPLQRCRSPPGSAAAAAAAAATPGAPSPFTDDTARALGRHAPDDTALALAAQLLAAATKAGAACLPPLPQADRDLRTGLLAAACRTLRTSLRDVLGPDGGAGSGGGSTSLGDEAAGAPSSSAAALRSGGGAGGGAAAGDGADDEAAAALSGLRLPSASFAATTARLAADLAISLAAAAAVPVVPAPPPAANGDANTRPRPPLPRPTSAAVDAAATLTSTADLLLEAAEACVALVWQVGQAAPAAARALAIAAAILHAAGPLLAAAAGARVASALDAPERVHALMRSAARLAEEADVRAAMAGGGGGAGGQPQAPLPCPSSPLPPQGFARVWRWDVGGLQSGVGELRPRPAGQQPSPVRAPGSKSAASLATATSLSSALSAPPPGLMPSPAYSAPPPPVPPRLATLPSSWCLEPCQASHPAAAAAAAAERLCDEASAALTHTLAAQWVVGEAEAVKAALVPLADLSAQADAGGASPREQQAELLTAGRLAASLAGDADMLAVVVPLLSESGVGGAAPAVRACAVHVVACLAALAGRVGQAWAHDAQVDALVKAYKAPDGYAGPLLWAGADGGGSGGGERRGASGAAAGAGGGAPPSTWAADACPGALADALLTVAAGCASAPPTVRAELLLRLLALFADVGAAARPGDGGAARDLGALLPAVAVAADGVVGPDGRLVVVVGDDVAVAATPAAAALPPPPTPRPTSSSAAAPPKRPGAAALASTSFGRPHDAAPADIVKAFRLLWLYVAVHGLAGVTGGASGGQPVAISLPASAFSASPSFTPPPLPSRRVRLMSALPVGGGGLPAWSTVAPTVWPAAWRAAAGRLARLTPPLVVLSAGESVKLGAELGARVHRLGGAALGGAAAAATAELVGRAGAPAPPAAPTAPEAWARAAHVFSVAVLELARAEAAPLPADPATAATTSPLDPSLAAQARMEPGMWVAPWLAAITGAACSAYCARLAGVRAPPSPDPAGLVGPCLDGLVRSLVCATAPAGGEPSADGLATSLLGGVLDAFPTLHWRPVLLNSLLASLGAHEAFAARAGMPAASATGPATTTATPLAAAAAAAATDPSLALTRRVLATAAARAPEHAEALLHEPLRGGAAADGSPAAPVALRHAAELMATVDAARPPPDPDAVAAPITGVEALSRKSYYGGLAAGHDDGGLAAAVKALEAAFGEEEDGDKACSVSSSPPIEDRILAVAAALVTAAQGDPASSPALHALAWAPAHRLTPAVVRASILAWAWVAAAAPTLRAPLAGAVGAAWLSTIDAQVGLFSRAYDAEAFHLTPGGDPDDHPALTRGVRAHGAWLAYWAELWAAYGEGGVGRDARAVTAILGRILHRSLADGRGLTQHPAAAGARARLVCLALRVAQAEEVAASPRPCPASAAILCQRALRAALLWHEGPPAWYGRWTPAEAADQAAAAAGLLDLVSSVAAWPGLAPVSPPPGAQTGASTADPVWGACASSTSGANRVALCRLLQAAEAERTCVWAGPMDTPPSPPSVVGRLTPSQWAGHARTAWDVSPRLALALPERLPACPALASALRDLVWAGAADPAIQAVPAAAALLAGDERLLAGYQRLLASGGESGVAAVGASIAIGQRASTAAATAAALASAAADRMDALTLWHPAPLLQALAMLGGPAGGIPAVRGYALRSLDRCPAAQVSVFLPQLVQLLRSDAGGGQIAAYLLAAARKSVLYAHILLYTLKAEGTPPGEAFAPAIKRSGWRPPADTGLWAIADDLARRVWATMPADKLAHLEAELAFFDAVTAVSGELYPVAKDERKNEAVRLVKQVRERWWMGCGG